MGGVAELTWLRLLRIKYFGITRNFSRLIRIFDSQEVENRLYTKKQRKIDLFRLIFVCFYANSGY